MDEYSINSYSTEQKAIESYLSESITSFGMKQLNGFTPFKLYISCVSNSGQIIGAIMGTVTLNMLFVSHLFVEEKHRNKGIGKKLLLEIEVVALESNCNIIRLNTFNKKTNNLYIKSGFEETTSIPNYMGDFDLVYYEKTIS
jgi:GNAT superfamily N-acetyltransferase